MKKQQNRIQQADIDRAKQVDIYKVLEEFEWTLDTTGTKILCPSLTHNDKHAGVPINRKNNTCRCFSCGKTFDTIKLVQLLSFRCRGIVVPFPKTVKYLFDIDNRNMNTSYTGTMGYTKQQTTKIGTDIYDKVLQNSTEIRGYEIDYLKRRGIFVYSTYVYQRRAYTEFEIKNTIKQTADQSVIDFYKEIKKQGTYYSGIANCLRKNQIQIRHNYYQNTNYILYVIDYDYETDTNLQSYAEYLNHTSRHMLIQKSIEDTVTPIKKMQGEGNFCILAEGISSNDIYICEGIEDALTYVQNGFKAISLNSISNTNSLIDYFQNEYKYKKNDRFILSLEHDEGGETATRELIDYFEKHNNMKKYQQFKYNTCAFPQNFNDINDYWISKVFQ